MGTWSAEQYLKFKTERTQPSIDLIHRIALTKPERIIDIGCGPGNSTDALARHYPEAQVLGVDNSEEMIAAAREQHPKIDFLLCDAGKDLSEAGNGYDLVFSNACIQWIPDHPALIRRLKDLLRPEGVLAVQTPMNYEEPIHQIIAAVSKSETWAPKFENPRIFYNLTPEGYYDLLAELFSESSIWMTTYFHIMPSHESIMEWYRGTGLRPYLQALDEADRKRFEAEIFCEVQRAYPVQKDGSIIFRFPRLFFTAVR